MIFPRHRNIEIQSPRGLSDEEVRVLQKEFGKNVFRPDSRNRQLKLLWKIIREPMFLLLVIACALYFILGQTAEGIMMAITMLIVSAISVFQDTRSARALDALKEYIEPKIKVIRNSQEKTVDARELVPGDIIIMEEGMKVPADAVILDANDLIVNESIITGESVPVSKGETEQNSFLFQGSTIEGGKCTARVSATGNNTTLGKIGKAVSGYSYPKTHLQVQVNRFVKKLALFGLGGFLVILSVNYLHYQDLVTSLLFALTLAMSAVPEEIPVAFSSFMALGAFKMGKFGIISRQPQVIENLGAVTVLCLDKTGTITENRMEVKILYDHISGTVFEDLGDPYLLNNELLLYATLASESNPFDSMEKAIVEAYKKCTTDNRYSLYKMVHEYPLAGKPPMMTHVYNSGDHSEYIIAAKGAPEKICSVCKLDPATAKGIEALISEFGKKGYRVMGVAGATYFENTFPISQDDFNWNFKGLLALYDPPRQNAKEVLRQIRQAGINIKLITGDFSETAITISQQVGLDTGAGHIDGEQVMRMNEKELSKIANDISVFTRMYPEAKLKVINTLKANGEIVAMTGDGINDAAALKAADIGIAMGRKGTETARRASDIILSDDDLEKIPLAISEGRKILNNLRKGIRYIISIHIPIILIASLPVILGWTYPNIFTPVHVIFLELVMGPTCSVFFENEPVEQNLMALPPRKRKTGLFKPVELLVSIVQGLAITAGVLILYHEFMKGYSLEKTRTIVFTTLVCSNIFLTFSARSFTKTIYHTIRYKNNLAPLVLIISIVFLLLFQFVSGVRNLFGMTFLSLPEFFLCLAVALATVAWFELYKWITGSK